MKKKLKGFTLIEMMIVLCIFSAIMFSVLQLLDPVSKFFVRSSNFENTTACIDNMKRCIEGNLKYADRVRAFSEYAPYEYTLVSDGTLGIDYFQSSYTASTTLKGDVERFYNDFFENRAALDDSGFIYVLCFDSTQIVTDTEAGKLGLLTDISDNALNSGKMVMYRYWFDNNDPNYDSAADVLADINGLGSTDVWCVNQKLYGNFEYSYGLGAFNGTFGTATFNPADFTINIDLEEIKKKRGEGLYREDTKDTNVSSFSMKNVLDSSVTYSKSATDFKLAFNGTDYTSTQVSRYASINQNTAPAFDGFYFIYTLAETTFSSYTTP